MSVIAFPADRTRHAAEIAAAECGTVIILPVIRIERHEHVEGKTSGSKKTRRGEAPRKR